MQQQARIRSRVEDLKKLAQEVDIFFTKFGSQIIAYAHPMIVGTSRSVLHCPSQAGCSGITNTTTVFKMQQRSGFNSKDFQASTKAKRFQIRVSKELDISRQKYFHVLLSHPCPVVLLSLDNKETYVPLPQKIALSPPVGNPIS